MIEKLSCNFLDALLFFNIHITPIFLSLEFNEKFDAFVRLFLIVVCVFHDGEGAFSPDNLLLGFLLLRFTQIRYQLLLSKVFV